MCELKHSPGPWTIGKDFLNVVHIVESGGEIVAGTYNVLGLDDKNTIRKANTNLIAAAPDMLEALQDVVKWYENPKRFSGMREIPLPIEMLTDTIRKALEG